MKKILDYYERGIFKLLSKKTIRVMRMTLLLSVLTVVQLWATESYSQSTKISLKLEKVKISEVLNLIEDQSEFFFLYSPKLIDVERKVDLTAQNEPISDVLTDLFGNSVKFAVNDRQIILAPDYLKPVSQQKQIQGTVTDKNGEPIPGANVVVKGTVIGTMTDANGKYTLPAQDPSAVIQFSFIGYTNQTITVGNQSQIDVILEVNAVMMNEVVVTAMGIEKSKKSLTYSTQQVNMDGLTASKNISLGNALAGKLAGVSVVSSTGASGVSGDPRIVIRGNKSITGNNQPLIVIDGIPSGDSGAGLTGLNTDDVQSINILKGSAATALYGSQAQNGAILVTTKKGKYGAPKIEVNTVTNFDIPYMYPEFQNEYSQGTGGLFNTLSYYSSWGEKMNGQTVTDWTGNERSLTPQKNNVKDFFRTGFNTTNSFSYSAGNEKSTAYFSYSNTVAQGLIDDNKLTRHNFNLRLTTELVKKLHMDFKITYYNQHIKDRHTTGDDIFSPMFNLIKMPRSIRTEDIRAGSYYDETFSLKQLTWTRSGTGSTSTTATGILNPYWSMMGYENPKTTNVVNTYMTLRYNITNWLYVQLRGNMSVSNNDEEKKTYWDSQYIYSGQGNYWTSFNKNQTMSGDVLIVMDKKLTENLSLNLNLGSNIYDTQSRGMQTDANGLTAENKFALSYAQGAISTDSESRVQLQSVYGMGQLSYHNYLFLDITGRKEWNSTLPYPHSYFYPSVGLTGIISDMVQLPDLISFFKVRGSYAETGNNTSWATIYNTYSAGTQGPVGTFSPSSTKRPVNLIPERTKSWEIGSELKLLEGRVGFDFTWYKSNTFNQLMCVTTPASSGYSKGWINAGNIQNSGVEIMFSVVPVKTTDFEWDADLNFARNKNKVIELTETLDAYEVDSPSLAEGETWAIKGHPYGEIYTSGFKRNTEGKIIVDALGMPVIDLTANPMASKYLGNFNYDWQSGITNNLRYKNWNMSFLIDLNYGGVRQSATEAMMLECGTSKASLEGRETGIIVDGVQENTDTEGNVTYTENTISISAQTYSELIGGRMGQGSSGEPFNHSATNSRLREFSLGYEIPLKNNVMKSLRISVIGRNLFYIYNGCKWFDPDVTYSVDTNGQGAESGFLPGTRTIGFNIKLTL